MGKDYYSTLGVSKDATDDQLKKVKSYTVVCRFLHQRTAN